MKEQKAEEQKVALQDLTIKKKKRGGSLEKATLIKRAFENAEAQDSLPPSADYGEDGPKTTRNLKAELRKASDRFNDSVTTARTSPPKLSAATELRGNPKEASAAAEASGKEALAPQ